MSTSRYALAAMLALLPAPALAQSMPGMSMPGDTPSSTPPAQPGGSMPGMDMPNMDMSKMTMPGMGESHNRWQIHSHTQVSLVADDQQGPRGGSKTFVEGMVMVTASRDFGENSSLEFNAMLSPDPFMGKAGYPLLLQSGETADGVHPLVDRQHPHDLFMGLGARLTRRFDGGSAFVEAGYPGETPFGPETFMHRASGDSFPTAPITHHWLDSGHITMGVLTAGVTQGSVTFEVSRFTGREPDQNRYDLDPVRLDSTAARLTWRISDDLSAQASWAVQVSPEALEPDIDVKKTSLSLSYGHTYPAGRLDSTLAWGSKSVKDGMAHGHDKGSDAWLIENTFRFNGPWQGLLRYERTYNAELTGMPAWVAKTEVGVIRNFAFGDNASIGLGVVRQFNAVPEALKPAYGDHTDGTIAFVQFRLHTMKM